MHKWLLMAVVGLLPLISLTHAEEDEAAPTPTLYEAEMPEDMDAMPMMEDMEGMPMMKDMEGMKDMKCKMMSGEDFGKGGFWGHRGYDMDGKSFGWIIGKKLCMLVFGALFLFVGAFALRAGWEIAGRWQGRRK